MKTLVIWDLHGLSVWEKLVKEKEWDKVVFLWDYVDSFTLPDKDIFKNLVNIIKFKRANMNEVVLLFGNHDIQYIWEWHWCSWRRPSMELSLSLVFKNNLDLFKIVHKEWNYIFSHSGILNQWVDYHKEELDEFFPAWFIWDEIETLNDLLMSHKKDILFECWAWRGWHNKYSWPLWADIQESKIDWQIEWFVQVVWHTKVHSIERYGDVIYCDNLEYWDGVPLILNR